MVVLWGVAVSYERGTPVLQVDIQQFDMAGAPLVNPRPYLTERIN